MTATSRLDHGHDNLALAPEHAPHAPLGGPTFSVVIPNYNGIEILGPCLTALTEQSSPADEVIVVDDASTDASIETWLTRFPTVRFIALAQNVGFAAAVNVGIRAATGDLIALLNNDTEVDATWVAELRHAAVTFPDAGSFACRMITYDTPPRIDSAGLAMTRGFGQLSIGNPLPDSAEFDRDREVLGACGGAAVYRRALLDQIGLLDESLFMQWEDYDLALRAQLRGASCRYVAAAKVRHRGSATLGVQSHRSVYYYCRNQLPVVWKNIPLTLLLRQAPAALAVYLRGRVQHMRRGRLLAAIQGDLAAIPRLLRQTPNRRRNLSQASAGAASKIGRLLDEGSRLRLDIKRAIATSGRADS